MAKDKITEYDATANNNTVCGDVNIAENSALPSDMNNFAREIMSHLKEGLGSGTPLYVDQTNNRVGINKTPTVALDVSGDADLSGTLDVTGAVTVGGNVGIGITSLDNTYSSSHAIQIASITDNNWGGTLMLTSADGSSVFSRLVASTDGLDLINTKNTNMRFFTNNTERMRITSAGKVGINTTNPTGKLEINGSDGALFAMRTTGDTANQVMGTQYLNNSGAVTAQTFATGDSSSSSVFRIKAIGSIDLIGGDIGVTGASPDLRIDSSGNVGIGTSSPASDAGLSKILQLGSSSDTSATFVLKDDDGDFEIGSAGGSLRIYDDGLERMRLDSSGSVAIGDSNPTRHGQTTKTLIYNGSATTGDFALHVGRVGTGAENQVCISNGYGKVGSITTNVQSTAYNTTSDHRLKENVTADWDATTRLKQLNPVRFNFIADADTTVDGFLAHEVQSVVPEAISGTHNEVDADGNPVYQGIDQSKLVPLLVKTIQELEARIVALETA